MQTLDKRHDDRARRKADNRAERNDIVTPAISVGTVVNGYRSFATLRARLRTDQEREELEAAIAGVDEEFANGGVSLAEAEDGNTMAGIGVVNTAVVPASKGVEQVQPLPKSEVDPANGNLNGAALTEQLGDPTKGNAWGSSGSPSTADLKRNGGGDAGTGEAGATATADAKEPAKSGTKSK